MENQHLMMIALFFVGLMVGYGITQTLAPLLASPYHPGINYHQAGNNPPIDPYIDNLANNRVEVRLVTIASKGYQVFTLKPVLMWVNPGNSTAGEPWTDYIYAYVRQTPYNGVGDVEAIVEFWDARGVAGKNYIQIEANKQAGGTITMYIDGVPKVLSGYTGGFLYPNTNQIVWGQPLDLN